MIASIAGVSVPGGGQATQPSLDELAQELRVTSAEIVDQHLQPILQLLSASEPDSSALNLSVAGTILQALAV